MTAKLLLGLLLITTLAAAAAPDRPQPAEDPCALAKRIAQSPFCLARSACEAPGKSASRFESIVSTSSGTGSGIRTLGGDPDGDRAGFLRMVQAASRLAAP